MITYFIIIHIELVFWSIKYADAWYWFSFQLCSMFIFGNTEADIFYFISLSLLLQYLHVSHFDLNSIIIDADKCIFLQVSPLTEGDEANL